MRVTFDWFELTAVVGAIQGILLAGVLVAHRTNRLPNRLLATLMVTFTIYLLEAVYYSSGLIERYPHFFGISGPLPWVFGPLVYLYAVTASDGSRGLRRRDGLHLVPPIISVIATLPFYMMTGAEKVALFARLRAGDVPTVLRILTPLMLLSGLSYSVATVVHLLRHQRRIRNSYSNTERVNLRWLLWLAGSAGAIWLLATGLQVSEVFPRAAERSGDDMVAIAIALLVYAIGYRGLRQSEVFQYDVAPATPPTDSADALTAAPIAPPENPSAEAPVPPPEMESGAARQDRPELGAAEAAKLKSELLALMSSQRPYRDPNLTLADLAGRLKTTPHKLSELLNADLGQSFYDFVNAYRVEHVQRRLVEPKYKHLKVLALAMDAGFASKSTFNEVFKKRTGQTPSTYRKSLQAG